MALRYQNPPLVEALCELRFESAPGKQWDWTVPGLLYGQLQERFPTRRERHELELPARAPAPLASASQRLQFVSRDESTIVQIGQELLAINSLRPHLGWPELRDTLLEVLEAYRTIAAPARLTMAAVRYINRVELPLRGGFALDRYFRVLPGVPDGTPPAVSTFLIHTESTYGDPSALFRFRFGTTASSPEAAAFIVDYEHVAAGDIAPAFDGLAVWLDAAHDRIEQAFYGSFTADTHAEVFREVKA